MLLASSKDCRKLFTKHFVHNLLPLIVQDVNDIQNREETVACRVVQMARTSLSLKKSYGNLRHNLTHSQSAIKENRYALFVEML